MAWVIFGTFFLYDSHAPWWVYPIWFAAVVYDWVHDRKKLHVVVDQDPHSRHCLACKIVEEKL